MSFPEFAMPIFLLKHSRRGGHLTQKTRLAVLQECQHDYDPKKKSIYLELEIFIWELVAVNSRGY